MTEKEKKICRRVLKSRKPEAELFYCQISVTPYDRYKLGLSLSSLSHYGLNGRLFSEDGMQLYGKYFDLFTRISQMPRVVGYRGHHK